MTLVALSVTAPLAAQGPRLKDWHTSAIRLRDSAAPGATPSILRIDSTTIRRSYWLEGGAILGGGLFVGGLTSGHNLCDSGNCLGPTLGLSVLAGALGFTVGALIGGQIAK
jgi:hypothetical protein